MLMQEPSRLPALAGLPPAAPVSDGLSVGDLFAMLRRRIGLILVVALLGTVVAVVIGTLVPKTYAARATIVFDPNATQLTALGLPAADKTREDESLLDTEIELIVSRGHLEGVMADLDLFDDPEFQRRSLLAMAAPVVERVAARLPWLVPAGWAAEIGAAPAVAATEPVNRRMSVELFARALQVRQSGEARVIYVEFTARDRERAATIANRVAERYVEARLDSRQAEADQAAAWLSQRLAALRDEVHRSEQAVADFRNEHDLFGRTGGGFNEQKIADLNHQLLDLRGQQVAMEAKLRRVRALRAERQEFDALAQVLNSPLIADLIGQAGDLYREQTELAQTYGERHPKMVNLGAELAELRARVRREIDRAIVTLEDELAVVAARAQTLKADLAETRDALASDQQAAVRLLELERQAELSRQQYGSMIERLNFSEERGEVLLADATILARAVPPDLPATPPPTVFGLIGFTVSTMIGGFLALLLERLNRKVRSATEMERSLGLTVLGLTPKIAKRRLRDRADRYVIDKPMSVYAELVRSILMSLRLSERGANAKTLMVTSALPNEGKTTLAISLAAAARTAGFKVLLIDLDLRRPALDRRLTGRASRTGLVDFLSGTLPMDRLVQHDDQTDLDYILCGRPPIGR